MRARREIRGISSTSIRAGCCLAHGVTDGRPPSDLSCAPTRKATRRGARSDRRGRRLPGLRIACQVAVSAGPGVITAAGPAAVLDGRFRCLRSRSRPAPAAGRGTLSPGRLAAGRLCAVARPGAVRRPGAVGRPGAVRRPGAVGRPAGAARGLASPGRRAADQHGANGYHRTCGRGRLVRRGRLGSRGGRGGFGGQGGRGGRGTHGALALGRLLRYLRHSGGRLALPAPAGTTRATGSAPAAAAGPALAVARVPVVLASPAALAGRRVVNRLKRHQHAPPAAAIARHRECLQQARPDPLASHLDQAERGHLRHLVLGTVPREAFKQPPEHQIAVALQHHVDEVDDDDAAHIPDPQLPDDLLGGLQVVTGDGLLQVAAVAGELAGVHVDDGHGLGRVDHQRPAAWQPDLPVQCLGDLLVDPVGGEDVLVTVPAAEPVGEVRRDIADIVLHHVPLAVAGDDQAGEVLVKNVPDYPDGQIRLAVEQLGGGRRLRLLLDGLPLHGQPGDILRQLFLGGPLGGGPDDDPGVLRHDLLQDLLQPGPLGVGQLPADPGHPRARHVDQVAAGQAYLAGQPGALVADRVLGGLHEDRLARLERGLDALGLAFQPAGIEVDLARIQDGVPALADVDERGLHGGQHVLHLAEVDVADIGLVARLVHVVLDKDPVLEHRDLGPVAVLPHDHDPVHGLAPGEELGLGDDRRAPAARLAALAPPLPLGLQPGRAAYPLDVTGRLVSGGGGAGGADMDDGVRRVIGSTGVAIRRRSGAPPAPPAAGGRRGPVAVLIVGLVAVAIAVGHAGRGLPLAAAGTGALARVGRPGGGLGAVVRVIARGAAALAVAAAAPAPALARRGSRAVLAGLPAVVLAGLRSGLVGRAVLPGGLPRGSRGTLPAARLAGASPAALRAGGRAELRRLEDHQRRLES